MKTLRYTRIVYTQWLECVCEKLKGVTCFIAYYCNPDDVCSLTSFFLYMISQSYISADIEKGFCHFVLPTVSESGRGDPQPLVPPS